MQRITNPDGSLTAVPTKAHWAAIENVRELCDELAYIEGNGDLTTERGDAAVIAAEKLAEVMAGKPEEKAPAEEAET